MNNEPTSMTFQIGQQFQAHATASIVSVATTDSERMAPGHPYNPDTGTGILWFADRVELWDRGVLAVSAGHETLSAWEFWYGMHFREAFPDVTHWWFGSAWTGKVWVRAIDTSPDGNVILGGMRFIERTEPEQLWQITLSEPVRISTPLPQFEVNPANLPLRIALAQLVLGLHTGDVAGSLSPDEEQEMLAELAGPAGMNDNLVGVVETVIPSDSVSNGDAALDMASPAYILTSLVRATQLDVVFPTSPVPWQLEGTDIGSGAGGAVIGVGTRVTLREVFCSLLGLPPHAVETGHL